MQRLAARLYRDMSDERLYQPQPGRPVDELWKPVDGGLDPETSARELGEEVEALSEWSRAATEGKDVVDRLQRIPKLDGPITEPGELTAPEVPIP